MTSARLPTAGNPVVIATGETAGATGVTSDSEACWIVITSGRLLLCAENMTVFL